MNAPASVKIVALFSVLPALFTVVGWIGFVFGPRGLIWCGMVGFVGAALSLVFRKRVYDWREAKQWKGFLSRTEVVLGILCALSLVIMFASSRSAGVAAFPALESRPVYELNSHGHRTAVTRLRYVAAAASFATGWNGMALLLSVVAFRKRFGID